jgi:hypothetical protein
MVVKKKRIFNRKALMGYCVSQIYKKEFANVIQIKCVQILNKVKKLSYIR